MLTQSDLRYDTRVLREAEALGRAGFDVHVIHRTTGEKTTSSAGNGVAYHAIPLAIPLPARRMLKMLRIHSEVLARGASRIPGSHTLPNALELLAVPLMGLALLASAGAHGLPRARGADPRSVGTLRGRVRRISHWLMQPLVYLNEHAANCLDELLSLNPDVIHAHDLVTLSAGAVGARRSGAALVYDAHEIETESNNWSLNRLTAHYVARYESTLIRRAAATITVTEGIADWLEAKYRVKRPVVVMNVPAPAPPSIRRGLREALGLARTVPLVVYVGGVMANRGLVECVRALDRLPGVHLALVGPRFPDTESAVRNEAASLGLSTRVHLVDPVPPAEVVASIADADCGVIPIQNVCLSYFYCFPNKLLETVLAGLPVAVADLLELRRFVEETGVGVVMDERDPTSIANALRAVLDEPARYRPTPEQTAEILGRYGWDVQDARLRECTAVFPYPKSLSPAASFTRPSWRPAIVVQAHRCVASS